MTCQPAVEGFHQLLDLLVRHDTIEALAVRVDHPHDVAEALQRRLGDRLEDVALVELGVTAEGDEPGRPATARLVPRCTARRRRTAGRRRRAPRIPSRKSATSGSFVRLGGKPAERPQPRQVRAVELAGEVLDGVIHGRGVRLHGHLVVAGQVTEPQRRHDPDHRRRGRLVTADLDLALRPLAVGVVHHPHGQPQGAPLDRLEDLGVRGHPGSPLVAWFHAQATVGLVGRDAARHHSIDLLGHRHQDVVAPGEFTPQPS